MLDRTKALIALALVAIVFGAGWAVNGWRLSGQHAQELAKRDREALEMAEAVKQIGIKANEILAEADAKGVKGIQDAKDETRRLRKCVADGTCSVHLKSSQAQQQRTSVVATSSLGNAASGISQGTAERVFDLYDAVNTDAEKLTYLQTYASTCWRVLDQASKLRVNSH